MYLIAGASGNTGSVVARTLLAHKQKVRVLVRSQAKGAALQALGADVAIGDVDNLESLTAALQGVSGAYFLLPGDYGSTDPFGRAARIADIMASAVEQAGVKHVTLLSSIGADLTSGNGIVQSLNIAEARLSKLSIGFTFLRAAYFMENWATSIAPALQGGNLYSFLSPAERKIPMVATQDIGVLAAYSLLFPTTTTRVIELAGPQDYSPSDVAAALATASGKPVGAVIAPVEGMAPMLMQFGMSKEMASEMAGLTVAINADGVSFNQAGSHLVRGTTTLDQVLGSLLRAGG
jgi:uncharacterized protein YbjT (DUF2867 family)